MGSGRVSSYSSRATRRTVGSGSKKRSRSRTAVTGLHGRRPARGILPLPELHRLLVARKAARRRIDAQRTAGRLSDVAEVAQQHALRPLLDRLPQRGAGADRVHEVVDVQGRHVVVGAGVEAVPRPRGEGRLHHLLLEIVHRITVAVEHHAAGRAQDGRAARPAERGQAVAALPLPDDGLPARELETGLLRIGELPIVGEVMAAAEGRDTRGVAHAQRPAGDVDLVRAVVADLARSPAPEPMPIVVNDVVAVRGVGRRALPQLVVQVRRDRHRLPAADRAPSVGIPGAREVGLPDGPFGDRLYDLNRAWRGALLRPHLHYAPVLALCLDQQLAFARVVPTWLLHVDVLPRLQREQRGGGVPMVGRRDHERVHVLVLECLAEVAEPFGSVALDAGDGGEALGEHERIDVAHVRHVGVGRPGEAAREHGAASVQAHDRDDDLLIRRTGEAEERRPRGRETEPGRRGGLQELAAFHRSRTLMLRKYTSSPWSWSMRCPRRRSPNQGSDRNLLLARAESMRAVPRWNSSSFSPFSQCSPWVPRKTSLDWFHSPTG